MDTKMTIRVVIIEDDNIIRDGIASLLNDTEGIAVLAQYNSFDAAAQHLQADAPEVILLDIALPGTSGLDAIPSIKKLLPAVYIVMLSVYENGQAIFTALSNGASGYLTKNAGIAKIAEAIREVVQGGGPMSAGIARMVIQSFQKNPDTPLSPRETEVLEGIAGGKSRSRIAQELFVDVETIKTHIKKIYHKLNVNSREEALRVARESRII